MAGVAAEYLMVRTWVGVAVAAAVVVGDGLGVAAAVDVGAGAAVVAGAGAGVDGEQPGTRLIAETRITTSTNIDTNHVLLIVFSFGYL